MSHTHIYDEQGNQMCCLQENKIYTQAGAKNLVIDTCCSTTDAHDHGGHDHDHSHFDGNYFKLFFQPGLALVFLLIALALDHLIPQTWFQGPVRILFYLITYAIVGAEVIKDAYISIKNGDVFSEFFLMTIATAGAFAIGEYPEAVAVMLFYSVGEVFQTLAISRATGNIQSLIDERPDTVTVENGNKTTVIEAEHAKIGDIIRLRPGEKLALDGKLLTDKSQFNTSALTGESKPDTKLSGDMVLAGMINLNSPSRVEVTAAFEDSKLSRILEMVHDATSKKAPTELFIRKFAKVYTPIVVYMAIAICLLPFFFVSDYVFTDWLYRALIFLVISCPCALVISIPLGYFGGIGAASKNGVLFKGGNFLDALANIQNVVMDKTGTLTEGVFEVQEAIFKPEVNQHQILEWVNALETHSTHPVATAIHNYVGAVNPNIAFTEIEEVTGKGLRAKIDGKEILVGNFRLLDQLGVHYDINPDDIVYTVIAVAYDQKYVGHLTIADTIKEDAKETVSLLHKMGIKTTILSGDKNTVVQYVASQLGLDHAYGDLLPEDKVQKVQAIKAMNESVAFVGDGVNDAPVVAISDVGLAMGGLGSDATIETADVVIQNDEPSKIPVAIKIGKATKKIVWQNIGLAFIVKAIVLVLGAGGLATMWEAVFADVGVALLAILNAIRIQRIKF